MVVGSSSEFNMNNLINFGAVSHLLGLHRESYNHIGACLASNRSRSMYKLRQLYKSIEPVEEEQPGQIEGDHDYQDAKLRTASDFSKAALRTGQAYKIKKLRKQNSAAVDVRDNGKRKTFTSGVSGIRKSPFVKSIVDEELNNFNQGSNKIKRP